MLLDFRWGAACPSAHVNRSFIDPRRFSSLGFTLAPRLADEADWKSSSPQLMIGAAVSSFASTPHTAHTEE